MSGALNAEWLNQNANRAYPIAEDASRTPVDANGNLLTEVVLPNYVLVDFVLTVAAAVPSQRVFLASVAYVSNLLTFRFLDETGTVIGLVSIDIAAHTKNQGYMFAGVGAAYEDALGRVVVGDLATLVQDLPEGLYTFTLATAELEARTVRPALRGVRSLQISNLDSVSEYLYGHIKLVAGQNVKLTYNATSNAITIDAVGGANLNEACTCTTVQSRTNVVRTINGIAIEDVVITGDDQCIVVSTDGDKIVITDKCSAPCCDCPELNMLTDSLKILDGTVRNLEAYAQQLDERIRTFVNNYILSKTL